MRKILFTFLIFCGVFTAFSQSRDLFALAKGNYLGLNALFDQDENLYGYVAIYGYGKSGDKTKKFEYVFLDKNLNPVSNKEFEGDITAANYFGAIDFRGNLVLYPRADYDAVKGRDFFYPRTIEVNLKDNTIKQKVYYEYENNAFKEVTEPENVRNQRKEERKERRKNGFLYISHVYEIKEGGFIVMEYDDYETYGKNHSLKRYDDDKKLLWEYKYNTDGTERKYEAIRIIEKDDKHIYTILKVKNKKEFSYFFQVLDIKTGNIKAKTPITGLNEQTMDEITALYSSGRLVDNDRTFDDRIIISGRFYEKEKALLSVGLTRLVLDKRTFGVDVKNIYFIDFKPFIQKINKFSHVGMGYYLLERDFFFLKDGSVGILFEKWRPEGAYSASATKDMVYAFTDKDFKLKEVRVFEKDKTKWSINADYLFSQYLNGGKDVAFFFRDFKKDKETKEKNWNLYINTLIDGKFNQENVKISEKDNYFVVPYIGKEGYILLREYNEKEKFNKIRLERLNF